MSTRWPDFFLIGAGKAGTSTIYEYLRCHPNICLPDVKEPQFFADSNFFHGKSFSQNEYLDLYNKASQGTVVGDCSTSYFICKNAPKRIFNINRKCKIIVILRDPIARSYSDYLMLKRKNLVRESFVSAIRKELERIKFGIFELPYLVKTSLYHENISEYARVFDLKNILILFTEELNKNSSRVLSLICEFLKLDKNKLNGKNPGIKRNEYIEPRFRYIDPLKNHNYISEKLIGRLSSKRYSIILNLAKNILYKAVDKPEMPHEAYDILIPIYSREIERLKSLIGEKAESLRDHWP
jgi:hypothetical protein